MAQGVAPSLRLQAETSKGVPWLVLSASVVVSPAVFSGDMQASWNWEASFSVQWPSEAQWSFSLGWAPTNVCPWGDFMPIPAVSVQVNPSQSCWVAGMGQMLDSSEAGHQFVLFTTPSLRGFGLTGFFLFVAGTWGELTLPLPNQVPLSDLHCLHLSEGSREALPSLSCLEKIHLSSLLGANSPCCSDYTCNSAEGRTGGSRPAWAGPCIQVEGKREERKSTLSQKMFEPRRSQIQPFN